MSILSVHTLREVRVQCSLKQATGTVLALRGLSRKGPRGIHGPLLSHPKGLELPCRGVHLLGAQVGPLLIDACILGALKRETKGFKNDTKSIRKQQETKSGVCVCVTYFSSTTSATQAAQSIHFHASLFGLCSI